MSAIDDLAAAVAGITDSVSAEIAALVAALAVVGQDAAIEASVVKLNALNDALKASIPQPVPVPVTPIPVIPDPTPAAAPATAA